MDSNDALINALYSLKCEQIVIAWLNPATRPYVSSGYAYAMAHKMFPYFTLNSEEKAANDPFKDCYKIKCEFFT